MRDMSNLPPGVSVFDDHINPPPDDEPRDVPEIEDEAEDREWIDSGGSPKMVI